MIVLILSYVGLFFYGLNWFFALLGIYVAKTRYNGREIRSPLATSSTAPGVTILRPLRGVECNLYENLEASFLQDYPTFEILFSVAEKDDASIPIVQALMKKYPKVNAQLIIGEEIVGVNPKINNLIRTYRQASYDILWIIDSNVLTNLGCLARSVSILTAVPLPGHRQVGLIHHLPFAIFPDSQLGSRVEQVFLCSTHAKMYLAINQLVISSCVAGKSCLFRKSDLETAVEKKRTGGKGKLLGTGEGGLASFGKYLGEDNMIGEALWDDLGMKHAMGSDMAGNTVGSMKVETYFKRRVRWIRVRKYMVVASTALEPLTECFLSGLIGSYILYCWYSISPILFLLIHIMLWYYVDITVFSYLSPSSPATTTHIRPPYHDGPGLAFFRAWLTRESLAFPLWAIAMGGDMVAWRDNGEKYRVRIGGSVERVSEFNAKDGWADRIVNLVIRLWGKEKLKVLRYDSRPSSSNGTK